MVSGGGEVVVMAVVAAVAVKWCLAAGWELQKLMKATLIVSKQIHKFHHHFRDGYYIQDQKSTHDSYRWMSVINPL